RTRLSSPCWFRSGRYRRTGGFRAGTGPGPPAPRSSPSPRASLHARRSSRHPGTPSPSALLFDRGPRYPSDQPVPGGTRGRRVLPLPNIRINVRGTRGHAVPARPADHVPPRTAVLHPPDPGPRPQRGGPGDHPVRGDEVLADRGQLVRGDRLNRRADAHRDLGGLPFLVAEVIRHQHLGVHVQGLLPLIEETHRTLPPGRHGSGNPHLGRVARVSGTMVHAPRDAPRSCHSESMTNRWPEATAADSEYP